MDAVAEPDAIQFVGFRLDRRRRVLLQLDKGGDAAPANIGAACARRLGSWPAGRATSSPEARSWTPYGQASPWKRALVAVQISTLRRARSTPGRTEGSLHPDDPWAGLPLRRCRYQADGDRCSTCCAFAGYAPIVAGRRGGRDRGRCPGGHVRGVARWLVRQPRGATSPLDRRAAVREPEWRPQRGLSRGRHHR